MEVSTEERFFKNLNHLGLQLDKIVSKLDTDEVEVSFKEGNISLALVFLAQMDKETIIKNFIKKSHKYWDNINERNISFFDQEAFTIFKGIPENKINSFKELFKREDDKFIYLKESDVDLIWRYFDSMVRISIKHIHNKRVPVIEIVNKEVKHLYKEKYFPEIDIGSMCSKWKLVLTWPKDERDEKVEVV